MPRKWGVLKAARKVLWTKAPEPEKSKPSVHWDTVETPSTSATAQGTDSAMVRTTGLPCSMLHACGLSLAAGPQLAACGLYLDVQQLGECMQTHCNCNRRLAFLATCSACQARLQFIPPRWTDSLKGCALCWPDFVVPSVPQSDSILHGHIAACLDMTTGEQTRWMYICGLGCRG